MPEQVKVTNKLLCELVSPSNNNKHTLVNVYSGDIVVSELPAHLQFGLYIEAAIEPGYRGVLQLEIRWLKKAIIKGETEVGGKSNERTAVIVLPSFPLRIDRDGVLDVFLSGDDIRRQKLLSKKIYKGPTS